MVDIYASSVAKDVFMWITIVVLTIGILWAFIMNILLPETSNTLIQAGNIYTIVGGYILKFGGPVLTIFSMIMLYIYQIFWRPYKHLKGVDDDRLNVFINENKNK